MTKTLIRHIKKIEDYRIFQNWNPSDDVEFKRVNLIYGQNGSGKSTLANLALGCTDGSEEELKAGLVASVETDGIGTQEIKSDSDPAFWERIRVFNKKFVDQNLAFNAEGGPQPQALLTIGKTSIEAAQQLAELRPALEETRSNIPEAEKEDNRAKKAVDRRLTEVATAITDALRTTSISQYNPRKYNRKNVKKVLTDFADDPTTLDDASTDLNADLETANSEAMRAVILETRQKVLNQDSVNAARALLATNVVVQVIEELRNYPDRATWVQQGIPLHEHLEDCLFCGQPLTTERRARLAAHFDNSLRKLQADIDSLINDFTNSVNASKNYLDAIPIDASVYPDLRVDLQGARTAYQTEHAIYDQTVEKILAALKEKRDSPFGDIPLDLEITLTVPDAAKVESVAEEHRKRIDRHSKEATDAARRVELYYIKNFVNEYKRLKQTAKDKERDFEALKKRAAELSEQITSLENVDRNPVPGAESLTNSVARLLGRGELTFNSTSDGKHYTIKRNGAPATNLSEGEQTAIALLYFLVSVRPENNSSNHPIVIIDDPVSSLDNSILFGASARIWSELAANLKEEDDKNGNEHGQIAQTFLMTHNFELFRQWLIQMESIPDRIRKKVGGYAAFEMRTTYEGSNRGVVTRKPELLSWPLDDKKTKRLKSQYHFLFSRVANDLLTSYPGLGLADQMDVVALMPNTARRLLEGFLSFRYPDKMGSFHGSMRAALEGRKGLDDSVRTHVERYLHAHSHLENADISSPLEPGESPVVLRSLFQFMAHVDHDHVSAMCIALDIDEAELLGRPASNMSAGDSHD